MAQLESLMLPVHWRWTISPTADTCRSRSCRRRSHNSWHYTV